MTAEAPLSGLLQRLRRNVGILSVGALITMVLGVLTLGFNARALGPALLGTFAMIQSYVVVINRVFAFDVWQGMIRFGAVAQERDDPAELRALFSFAILFDFASAVLAGCVGVAFLFAFSGWMKVPSAAVWPAAFYVSSLFLQLPGAPIGLLRFFNKFHWLTGITVVEAGARFAAAVILYDLRSPLADYLYAYAGILFAFNALRLVVGLSLLKRATGRWRFASISHMRRISRSFVRFSAGSWITGTLNVSRRDGTTLIVAALLGSSGAGFYAVAQRLIRPLRDVAELLRQAIYPELSRLSAAGRDEDVGRLLRNVVRVTIPLAIALAVLAIVAGKLVIGIAAGREFEAAYWPFVWLTCAASLYLCTPVLSSLAILYTGMRRYVTATVVAAAIWVAVLAPPMLIWGVNGAGVAEAIFVAAWVTSNLIGLRATKRGSNVLRLAWRSA